DKPLAIGLFGLELDLIAPLVSIEEGIAGAAEPLPQRFRLRPSNRADRLPFSLQPADFCGGAFPLHRNRELFGADAERFLLGKIGRPDFLALGEVGISPREERVARFPESLPGRPRILPWNRADRLPLALQLLQLFGRLDPVGRLRERLSSRD